MQSVQSSDAVVESYAGGCLADELARGCDHPLLNGWTGVALRSGTDRAGGRRQTLVDSNLAASCPDSDGDAPRSRPCFVLSAPSHLRTEMDQPQRGAVTGR